MNVLSIDLKIFILAFLNARERLKIGIITKEWYCILTKTIAKNLLHYDWSKIFYEMACESYKLKYAKIKNIKLWYKLPWNLCWHKVELVDVMDDNFIILLPAIVHNDFYCKSTIYRDKQMYIDFSDNTIDNYESIAPVYEIHVFDTHISPSRISQSNGCPNFIAQPFDGDSWHRCLVDVELTQYILDDFVSFAIVYNDTSFLTVDNMNHEECMNIGWQCAVVDWHEFDNTQRMGNRRQIPVWVDVTKCVDNLSHRVFEYLDVLYTGDSVWLRLYVFPDDKRVSRFGKNTSLKQQCTILTTPLFIDNSNFDYKTSQFLQKSGIMWNDIMNQHIIESPNLVWDFLVKEEINLKNLIAIRQYNGLLCLGCFVKFGNHMWLLTENNIKFPIDSSKFKSNELFTMVYKATEMYKNNIISVSINKYIRSDWTNDQGFIKFIQAWRTVQPPHTKLNNFCTLRVKIPYFFINANYPNNTNYDWNGNNKSNKVKWSAWSQFCEIAVNSTKWYYGISYDNNDEIIQQNGCIGVWIDISEEIKELTPKLWKSNSDFVSNETKTQVFAKFYVLFEGSDEIGKV